MLQLFAIVAYLNSAETAIEHQFILTLHDVFITLMSPPYRLLDYKSLAPRGPAVDFIGTYLSDSVYINYYFEMFIVANFLKFGIIQKNMCCFKFLFLITICQN